MKHKDPPKSSPAVVRVRFTLGPKREDSRNLTNAEIVTLRVMPILLWAAARWWLAGLELLKAAKGHVIKGELWVRIEKADLAVNVPIIENEPSKKG